MSILNSVWGLVFVLILGVIVLVNAKNGAADSSTIIKASAGGLGTIITDLEGSSSGASSQYG